MTLDETVRVEKPLEVGVHLLQELLPQEVDVGLLLACTGTGTATTPATSASAATTAATATTCVVPGMSIRRSNIAHGNYWIEKIPV